MPFQKGNNLGGRTRGAKGKVSEGIRKAFENLLKDNIETMQQDLNQLEPKERLKVILDLASYVVPKLKATELIASADITDAKPFNIQDLVNFTSVGPE